MKGSAAEVASLTRYVREQMKMLENIPHEELLEGKIKFGELSLVKDFPQPK